MLHGINNPNKVYVTSLQNFTIELLVAYLNLYTFNPFNNIIIRTSELSCSIKTHCTPVSHINTTYIVNVNVYKKGLYTNTKHLLTPW